MVLNYFRHFVQNCHYLDLTIYTFAFYMYYIFKNTWIKRLLKKKQKSLFILFRIFLPPFLPIWKGEKKRREIYFITPKKSLLGLEVQETRCNLSWGWRGKSLVHFCLNTYILHWGNLWGTKGFPLDNNTFQDLTILINNQGSEESLLILLFFFKLLFIKNELWHNLTTKC